MTDEEKARIAALGGWEALMETLRKRLEEQKARHQGGSKWIGTGGTSPFGAHGYNPEGVRIGQEGSGHSGVCGASRVRARRKSSTWTRPSIRRRGVRGSSTSEWSRSGTTP